MSRRHALALAAAGLWLAGCANPVVDDQIDALGPEVPGVAPSEFHRPGQPCVLCHGEYGGAEPEMSIGGTIFAVPARNARSHPVPVKNATVTLTDTTGDPVTTRTNCVGNFFFEREKYNPSFPIRAVVEVEVPGTSEKIRKVMATRISRDGSCAGCHQGAQGETSPGWVWMVDAEVNPFPEPDASCPGKAALP
jgi:hypothetical protein